MPEARREELEIWRERIAVFKDSGLSVRAWCTANDVGYNQMRYRLQIDRAAYRGLVSCMDSAWAQVPVAESCYGPGLTVRVGAVAIEVKEGFDPQLLRAVVESFLKC